MHQPAMLPENFDQIPQNTPVLEFGSRSPPQLKIVPRVQIWAYPEQPPTPHRHPKMKNSNFLPEFKSEITQNTHHPHPPSPENENLTFFLSSNLSLPRTPPPPHGGWSMWRLYPPRIPSRLLKMKNSNFLPEFKSELTQNTHHTLPPPENEKLYNFLPEFKSELMQGYTHR